ncbi:VWA domain-containing protein [Sulfurimonas sp. SAG-AH-194-C20]|nr:VWA domain-containing protein [Sulfurimonas sp. SAG-AH-194-C20]MDF1878678.1 VWA domain-containing protein [Sulfurimonas sp. SAG-AH-194-C20]
MYFAHPLNLFLLVLPLLLLLYSFASKKQTLTSIFSPDILKTISVNSHLIQSALKYRLFLLVITLFVLALAQPVLKHSLSSEKEKSINLMIALDISKSMLKDDVYPSRLELALSKIKTLMNTKYKLRVGLLLFGESAYVAHPLSEDKKSLLFITKSINYSQIIENKTNLFSAIEGASIMFKSYNNKNLLILSDITSLQGFRDELDFAKDNNISINILSITKEPTYDSVTSYTYSSDDINSIMNTLEQNTLAIKSDVKGLNKVQLFYVPLLLALCLLLFIYASDLEFKTSVMQTIVFITLMSFSTQSRASILDFYHLSNAKSSYTQTNYESALVSYKKLPQTQVVLYNIATTQYRLELYDEAIKSYLKSIEKDDVFNARVYYNIGNAYVRIKKLHLAKKYYLKSLRLVKQKSTQENLEQVKRILSNQKHKIAKDKEDKYKLPQRISIEQKEPQGSLSSDYTVTLSKIVLSEEEKILQALKKQKPIIFLQKLDTHKRSKNVLQD